MEGHGKARFEHCDEWQIGEDCGFDERNFYIITSALWLVTSLVVASKAFLPFGKAPTGTAKSCLLATAASSTFMSLDAMLYVLAGPHSRHEKTSSVIVDLCRKHVCNAIGTILLAFALRWFGWLWCTISGALEHNETSSTQMRRIIIKVIYDFVALVNVPFAICLVGSSEVAEILGIDFLSRYHIAKKLWMGWCVVAVGCGFTLNSSLMWIHVRNSLSKEAMVGNFTKITKINLVEQLIFDLCLGVAGLLYLQPIYKQHGAVQASCYSLLALTAWMMHVQVLIFFVVATPDDPLYSKERLDDLLLLSSGAMAEDKTMEPQPKASSTHKAKRYPNATDSLKPSVIGSPDLESARAR
jgi:hypothetical protein